MTSQKAVCYFLVLLFIVMVVTGCSPSKEEDEEENRDRNQEGQDRDLRAAQAPEPPEPPPPPEPTPIAPTITILQPDGGEVISQNTYTIEWRAADEDTATNQLDVLFEYQYEGGIWIRFTDYMDNDGTHLWDLSKLEEGQYRIRATVTDGTLETTETSGPFAIGKEPVS